MLKIKVILLIILLIVVSVLIVIFPTFLKDSDMRIEVNQSINLKKVLDTNKTVELVFFGYSGCVDICSPRLFSLSNWYSKLDDEIKEKFTIRFMDISQPKDKELPKLFADAFHEDFVGVYLTFKELRDYTKPFSVYFSKSITKDLEFDHSSNLYLVDRDSNGNKTIKYIYSYYPYNFKIIEKDLKSIGSKSE